jgi:hypothetical protein
MAKILDKKEVQRYAEALIISKKKASLSWIITKCRVIHTPNFRVGSPGEC